jgi:predicted nucleic acid-binding protein
MGLAETKQIEGYTSSIIFTNVYYVLRKIVGHDMAIEFLSDIESILTILPSNQSAIRQALHSSFSDFEDAIQNFTAVSIKADCILTRNLSDYKQAEISVLTPADFLSKNSTTPSSL